MAQYVKYGDKYLEFPDSMSDSDIEDAISKLTTTKVDKAQSGIKEDITEFDSPEFYNQTTDPRGFSEQIIPESEKVSYPAEIPTKTGDPDKDELLAMLADEGSEGQSDNAYQDDIYQILSRNKDKTETGMTPDKYIPKYRVEPIHSDNPEDPRDKMGFWASMGETMSGQERATPESRHFKPLNEMPEIKKSLLFTYGSSQASADERAKIAANWAGVDMNDRSRVRRDKKGNWYLKSSDGNWYASKPGLDASNVEAIIGMLGVNKFLGGGKTLLGKAGIGAGTEAAVQGVEAAIGGEFNVLPVAIAGAVPPAVDLLARGAGKAIGKIRGGKAVEEVAESSARTVPEGQTVVAKVTDVADDALPTRVVDDVAATQKVTDETADSFTMSSLKETVGEQTEELTKKEAKELAGLLRTATSNGLGAKTAKRKLAERFRANPQALKDMQDLGYKLPPDVISDDFIGQSLTGVSRKEAGSVAQDAWRKDVQKFTTQSDENLKKMGAMYTEGGPSVKDMSDAIKENVTRQMDDLAAKAEPLYKLKNEIPLSSKAAMDNSENLATSRLVDFGEEQLSPVEKELIKAIDDDKLTLGGLQRIKKKLGDQLTVKKDEFTNGLDYKEVKELYDTVKSDIIETIRRVGGDDAALKTIEADKLWAKRLELADQLRTAYKSDKGTVSSLLVHSMKTIDNGAKFSELNELLKSLPEGMRREALLTGISKATRSTSNASAVKGEFGASEFVDFYRKLMQNSEAVRVFKDVLGPERMRVLSGMNNLSKRMTKARALAERGTGANLQPMLERYMANNFVSNILATAGDTVGKVPLPGTAATGGTIRQLSSITNTGKKGLGDLSDLLNDPRFLKIIEDLHAGKSTAEQAAKGLEKTKTVKKYLEGQGVTNIGQWVNAALKPKVRQMEDKEAK